MILSNLNIEMTSDLRIEVYIDMYLNTSQQAMYNVLVGFH